MPDGQHFPRIEYKMLRMLVKKILFPQWNIMKVNWKCGLSSEVKMDFAKAGDHPYPTIKRKAVEHETKLGNFTKETYLINGKPLIEACPNRQIVSIRRNQDVVLNLVIMEPKSYEASVPCVYGDKSIVDKEKLARGVEE